MNEHFVCIKVDREERPDLDQIYMDAVQFMTGRGGWPMSVFLTPDLRPVLRRHVLAAERPDAACPASTRCSRPWPKPGATAAGRSEQQAGELTAEVQRVASLAAAPGELGEEPLRQRPAPRSSGSSTLATAASAAPRSFRIRWICACCCGAGAASRDDECLQLVTLTLDKMAAGGIYDHLGGGFHRYSVDERWLVPHFEKMLYDNALLAQCYVEAFQATGRE